VNFSTYTPNEAPLYLLAAEPVSTPNPAVIAAGWQDFFSQEMDRAIGLQEESFALATRAQAQLANVLEHEDWMSPLACNAFELTAQMLQCFVDLQRNWLLMLSASATVSSSAMTLPEASSHHLATLGSSNTPHELNEEVYARSMDIAIGVEAA